MYEVLYVDECNKYLVRAVLARTSTLFGTGCELRNLDVHYVISMYIA